MAIVSPGLVVCSGGRRAWFFGFSFGENAHVRGETERGDRGFRIIGSAGGSAGQHEMPELDEDRACRR